MAIAVRLDQDTKKTSVLNISAAEYYTEKLRPYMEEVQMKCTTDPEIYRTTSKIMNTCDSLMVLTDKESLSQANDVLQPAIKVLTADTYYRDGALRRATDEEVKMVKDLAVKFGDFSMLLRIEMDEAKPKETEEPKERIAYSPSHEGNKGENIDWKEHNMANLSAPIEKKRLPNL